jgi:hypothetical protein
VPLTPQEFAELVAPWKEIQPPTPPWDEAKTIETLDTQVRAAEALGEAGRVAAVGLIVAVGNYEYLRDRREPVLQKCRDLMDEFADQEHSWRWG